MTAVKASTRRPSSLRSPSMRQKSVTVDEIMYVAAGYYHLSTGDFRYNMTNPPFVKSLSALPLLALDVTLPPTDGAPEDWSLIEQWQYSREFMYDNTVDADTILFAARLPIVALSVLLGSTMRLPAAFFTS